MRPRLASFSTSKQSPPLATLDCDAEAFSEPAFEQEREASGRFRAARLEGSRVAEQLCLHDGQGDNAAVDVKFHIVWAGDSSSTLRLERRLGSTLSRAVAA